jgi:large subunit ribosomal protein L13
MKTFSPRPRDIERRWYVVDADGAVLGRLATQVATILRGKHKPIYAPHADTGDHVIVVNAKGIRMTGGKDQSKVYVRHSGYPGGLRRIGFERLLSERPASIVEKAIGGMLPKNRLGRQMLKKLAVYEGAEHPHAAQQPVSLGLGEYPRWTGLPVPAPVAPAEPKPAARKRAARRAAQAGEGSGRGAAAGTKAAGTKSTRAKTASAKGSTAKAATRKKAAAASAKSTSRPKAAAKSSESKPDEGAKPKRAARRAKKES